MYASKLVGKKVYTAGGVFVGVVEDIIIDLNRKRISKLIVSIKRQIDVDCANENSKEQNRITIPYEWTRCGDIIIVNVNDSKRSNS
ncbi:MAG: PRC-barrel domain-containing protein [Candidatus Baldrarchaeia archaeon]